MGDTDDARPVYQRIADDLRRQIDEGTLRVGARIPSRAELKRSYTASDQTVDRAVRVLKSAGYAEGQFGRGVFVTDRAPVGTLLRSTGAVDSPFAARIAAVGGGVGPAGGVVWEAVSNAAHAPDRIAERLRIAPGDPVMCTHYEYLADRRPVQLATSWEPLAITEGTDVVHPERGPYARRGVRGRLDRRRAHPLRRGRAAGGDLGHRGAGRPLAAGVRHHLHRLSTVRAGAAGADGASSAGGGGGGGGGGRAPGPRPPPPPRAPPPPAGRAPRAARTARARGGRRRCPP
ncbi:GntR family transcriptional regulator [Streptomyces sp. NRRL S-1868]|uniref:GntR family transcriptional regulator n=1 Tax=Streptomyces sp. NRRL S-1868 TaxID=1463892 RepID=UPI001F1F758F|nr:GntR family transcriptional regulator [Streptomyces sp. NRRL S-1868]